MGKTAITNAKRLRQNLTPAEQCLWSALRAKRFAGVKFKRQKPIGRYIADFAAVSDRLVIEVDGPVHDHGAAYDHERSRYLQARGYRVLRFRNEECLQHLDTVLERIAAALSTND